MLTVENSENWFVHLSINPVKTRWALVALLESQGYNNECDR